MNKYQLGIIGIVVCIVVYFEFGIDQKTMLMLLLGIGGIILAGEKNKG